MKDRYFMDKFYSPTKGELSLEAVISQITQYIQEIPQKKYRLVIGTDCQGFHNGGEIYFVTAIVVHRVGHGGRFFWRKNLKKKIYSLKEKIYQETFCSLEVAQQIIPELKKTLNGDASYDLEIHIDIGENGQTKELIKEVVGMVIGSGFIPKIKPDSYGAFIIADRYA